MKFPNLIKRFREKTSLQKSMNTHGGSQDEPPNAPKNQEKTKNNQSTFEPVNSTPFEDQTEEFGSFTKTIGTEHFKKRPIIIDDQGFTTKLICTRDSAQGGLVREIHTPLLIGASGCVMKTNEIAIKCSICGRYEGEQNSFNCFSCGRAICRVDTFFFKDEDNVSRPYCKEDYHRLVNNINTWENKRGK